METPRQPEEGADGAPSFDIQGFMAAQLRSPEETISLPELKSFFPEGAKPEWTVRALTAAEYATVKESATGGVEKAMALIAAFSNGDGDKAQAIKNALGLDSEDTPEDITRRIDMLVIGSVSPNLTANQRDVAVKMAEYYPSQFYLLTNTILTLSGRGADEGKLKPSGSETT